MDRTRSMHEEMRRACKVLDWNSEENSPFWRTAKK